MKDFKLKVKDGGELDIGGHDYVSVWVTDGIEGGIVLLSPEEARQVAEKLIEQAAYVERERPNQ